MNKQISWDLKKIAEEFSHGKELKRIIQGSFVNVLMIHITPDSPIPPHYEDYDAIFFVWEGKGVIQIGEEKIPVSSGMMVASPKQLLRGITPDGPLLILGLQEPH